MPLPFVSALDAAGPRDGAGIPRAVAPTTATRARRERGASGDAARGLLEAL